MTLTATVSPAGATGRVTFWDGVNMLGAATLSSGTASFTTRLLPVGSHRLKARYLGDSSIFNSGSNVAAATVTALASNLLLPGGTNTLGRTANPRAMVVADLNGDGKADLATANRYPNEVSIFVANGDGTFQTAVNYAAGPTPNSVAAGDLNGDGITDLAVTNDGWPGCASILLGNVDGTFQQAVAYSTVERPCALAVADFNGDGIADIAVANGTNQTGSLLLGNGDGTFQAALSFTIGDISTSIVAGDLNGDGKADLVVGSTGVELHTLLGNGDGTFQAPVSYRAGDYIPSVAIADFNGDGKPDVAVADFKGGNVCVLPGKGDGTLQTKACVLVAPYPGSPDALTAGDFNGDGKIDLAVAAGQRYGAIYILLGTGDGGFQSAPAYSTAGAPTATMAADFNGDGKTDLAVNSTSAGSVSILLGGAVTFSASGTPQTAPINSAFAFPLQVRVLEGSTPVSGLTISFQAPSSGASLASPAMTAVTDASGLASVSPVANGVAGRYTVTASAGTARVSFQLTNSCVTAIGPSGASFGVGAASGSIAVTAPASCSWTAGPSAAWITIGMAASGTGAGTVSYTVAGNSGAARTGTIAVGGHVFTIAQEGVSTESLNMAGSIAQVASGGGWDTAITLVNLGGTPSEAQLNFTANDGSAPLLPFTFPQQPAEGTIVGATFARTLPAGASLIFNTTGPVSQSRAGSAQLATNGDYGAFAIFTYTPAGQAAVSPLETRNASSYLLAFDNTGAVSTGLALANLASTAANINVVIRDDTGKQIGSGTVSLPTQGHNSFMLTDSTYGFPSTANLRGTVEFDTPPNGRISVLGLRANAIPNSGSFAITSLPVLANVGAGGGIMGHIAAGGGWQTTVTLVNTGASATTANVNFYDGNGNALALPLSLPQTGDTYTGSSASRSIAPGASLIIVLQDPGGAGATGSAVLTTSGNVSGFAVFRYNPTGQEAVAPLQTVKAPSYWLAFDNTGSLSTGLAVANLASQAASVNVILLNDAGAQIGTGTINLPAHGHTSFMLTDTSSGGWAATAGVRGVIEFVTPPGGQIAPLGLRAASIPGGFTVTTIPVMAP